MNILKITFLSVYLQIVDKVLTNLKIAYLKQKKNKRHVSRTLR